MSAVQPEDVQARNRALLDAVRIRRDRFYDAILAVERAVATPAGDDPEAWAAAMAGPLDNLHEVLDAHVTGTEGAEGLFEQIAEDAPHLLNAVERLRQEHEPLCTAEQKIAAALSGVHDDASVDEVRAQALELVHHLLEHRHRGAELVYDAYAVDVSPAD